MKKQQLKFKICMLLLVMALMISCTGNKNSEHNYHKEHSDKNHFHAKHGFDNKINVEKMAKSFESPERDSIEQPNRVLQFIGDLKGKMLMDIGAGTGYYAIRFANNGANVIAADVSDEFQNYLQQRIKKNNIKTIALRKVEYDNPLLKDNEVDIVFIANTYHHIENRIDYLSKVKKGLNTNGELVILDYFSVELPKEITAPPMEMRVSVDQALFELKKAGFSSFKIEVNALKYHYIIKAK